MAPSPYVPEMLKVSEFVDGLRRLSALYPERLGAGNPLLLISALQYTIDPHASTSLIFDVMAKGPSKRPRAVLEVVADVHDALLRSSGDDDTDEAEPPDLEATAFAGRGGIMAWNTAVAETVERSFFSEDGPAICGALQRRVPDHRQFLGDSAAVLAAFAADGARSRTPQPRSSVYEPGTTNKASWFTSWCNRFGRSRLLFFATVGTVYHVLWGDDPAPRLPG